jgi:D-hydroxyproline dehydrogenase subunit beta
VRVVVVGAGIVGTAAAWFLAEAGAAVTVVEAESPAAGATGASDGAVSVGSKRPGPLMALARRARDLYRELGHDVLAGLFLARPTYLVARSEEEAALLARHGADLAEAGEPTEPLGRADLARLLPGIGAVAAAGLAVPGDGHALGYAVADRFIRRGAFRVLRDAPVRALHLDRGRAAGVVTAAGPLPADAVVVAAGLGSAALVGLGDVLVPRKGQLVVTDRAVAKGPALGGQVMAASYLAGKRRIAFDRPHVGLTIDPLATGQFLVGGTREEGRADRGTDPATIAAILREALELYPPLARRRVVRTFAGIRTATRDGLPIVGRHPRVPGLVVATGFEGDGICLGPLMGAVARDLVIGAPPRVGIEALDPARFPEAA